MIQTLLSEHLIKNETNYYYEYDVIQFFENTFFLLQKVDILYMLQKYMK